MENISEHVVELIFSVLGAGLFALIGFVWKISHRISALEKTVDSMKQVHSRDLTEVRRDIEVIYNNVDKNREWTTNRMMSIAKDMKD